MAFLAKLKHQDCGCPMVCQHFGHCVILTVQNTSHPQMIPSNVSWFHPEFSQFLRWNPKFCSQKIHSQVLLLCHTGPMWWPTVPPSRPAATPGHASCSWWEMQAACSSALALPGMASGSNYGAWSCYINDWIIALPVNQLLNYQSNQSIPVDTAQGGGGSFKDRTPIGVVSCCDSWQSEFMERTDGWQSNSARLQKWKVQCRPGGPPWKTEARPGLNHKCCTCCAKSS